MEEEEEEEEVVAEDRKPSRERRSRREEDMAAWVCFSLQIFWVYSQDTVDMKGRERERDDK